MAQFVAWFIQLFNVLPIVKHYMEAPYLVNLFKKYASNDPGHACRAPMHIDGKIICGTKPLYKRQERREQILEGTINESIFRTCESRQRMIG